MLEIESHILPKKKLRKKNGFSYFNLKNGFQNYIVAKIFDTPSNEKNVWKEKNIYTHTHKIQYAIFINSFC